MATVFGIGMDFDEQHFPVNKFGIAEVYQLDDFYQFVELFVDLLYQFFVAIGDKCQAGDGFVLGGGDIQVFDIETARGKETDDARECARLSLSWLRLQLGPKIISACPPPAGIIG